MLRKLLVRGARQLLTMQGPRGPRTGSHLGNTGLIPDGAVLISNGIITAVGPSRRVENLAEARNALAISAAGRVVLPGMVDCDAHPLEPAPPTDLQLRRLLALCTCHGTTTLEVKVPLAGNGSAHVRALKSLAEASASLYCCSSIYRSSGGVEDLPALLKRIRGRNLSQAVEVICGPAALPKSEAAAILELARRVGFRRKVMSAGGANQEAVELACDSGASCISGLEMVTNAEADRLAKSRIIATLVPERSARTLLDRGVPVAISSGFRSKPPGTLSMQSVIRAAVRHANLTLEEAISAATINAAHAAGQGEHSGSIEFGKEADLVLLDISDYRDLGQYHGVNLAACCLKRGELVYRRDETAWP